MQPREARPRPQASAERGRYLSSAHVHGCSHSIGRACLRLSAGVVSARRQCGVVSAGNAQGQESPADSRREDGNDTRFAAPGAPRSIVGDPSRPHHVDAHGPFPTQPPRKHPLRRGPPPAARRRRAAPCRGDRPCSCTPRGARVGGDGDQRHDGRPGLGPRHRHVAVGRLRLREERLDLQADPQALLHGHQAREDRQRGDPRAPARRRLHGQADLRERLSRLHDRERSSTSRPARPPRSRGTTATTG